MREARIFQDGDQVHEVTTPVADLELVKKALENNGIAFAQATLAWMPKSENVLEVQGEEAEKIIRLLEALEDLDDVTEGLFQFRPPRRRTRKTHRSGLVGSPLCLFLG